MKKLSAVVTVDAYTFQHINLEQSTKSKSPLSVQILYLVILSTVHHKVDLEGCVTESDSGSSKSLEVDTSVTVVPCGAQDEGESLLLTSGSLTLEQNQQTSQFFFKNLVMAAHIAALLFCAYIIYVAAPGTDLFSWHPTLMVLAYAAAMFEAVLVFSPHSSLVGSLSRQTKVTLHWSLASLSAVLALGGLAVIYQVKENKQKVHFSTWHGLLGLITVGYSFMQLFGGAAVKYYSFSSRFIKMRLADLKMTHAVSGVAAFTLVSTTLMLALYSNWVSDRIQDMAWYACYMAVGWMALVVMNQVTTAYAPRFKPRRH
ncbi:transmembrane reductase CYB561D2-like [Babylonia areolata]|uniref:transmembrane reductase CYB561D2-like n=1 Tax=Babylonia areolata TaxID=304850 RepID=UPI003FD5573E